MNKVYRGDDLPIVLQIRDAQGAPIPINTLDDVRIALVHKPTARSIATFSLEEDIVVIDNELGRIRILLESDKTRTAPEGNYQLELKIKREVDGSTHSRIAVHADFFSINATKLADS